MPSKSSLLIGHLTIDKVSLQMQHDEMKKAILISCCSQVNKVKYEMALEWMLTQEKPAMLSICIQARNHQVARLWFAYPIICSHQSKGE